MGRSLAVHFRCDLCARTATHVEVAIKIGAHRRRVLDLCPMHYDELIAPVLGALERHGYDPSRPTKPKTRQSHHRQQGPYLCKAGCVAAPLKNSTTLAQHLIRLHQLTMAEYVEKYGELVALTTDELAELVVEVRCPEGCGQIYSTERGNRYPQIAMVSHMWGHHGKKWSPAVV
jgi:hypothetical protein